MEKKLEYDNEVITEYEGEFTANVFRQLGVHASSEREKNDYYATEPLAVTLLLEKERFSDTVLEPCVGGGHIAEVLKKNGYNVIGRDIVDRGYPNTEIRDFLLESEPNTNDIVTNPPYKLATDFVRKALEISNDGVKVAMFLKIQFLESQERAELFKEYPIKYVYVASKRLNTARGGQFDLFESSAVCYAWFIWEKGWKGGTILRWINNGDNKNTKRKDLW